MKHLNENGDIENNACNTSIVWKETIFTFSVKLIVELRSEGIRPKAHSMMAS